MDAPIEEYLGYITAVRRYSPRTQSIYREVLEGFAEYCAPEGVVESLNSSMLRSFEVHLMDEKGLCARTVGLHMSVMSGFCRFLMKNGRLESNPVRTVTRPKVAKRLPVFYREESMDHYFDETAIYASEEVLGLISGRPGDKGDALIYDNILGRMIISILHSTGIRRSELLGLDLRDFDRSRKVFHIRGKGDKMRDVPIPDSTYDEILLYLRSIEKMGIASPEKDSPLLLTRSGARLYPVFVDRAVKRELGAVPEITARKSPHVLRHTLATELLDNGADINSIKELLGHSSLAATQVYTHNSIEKLKKTYMEAHPRASKDKNAGT